MNRNAAQVPSSLIPLLLDGLGLGLVIVDDGFRVTFWNNWMERHSSIREADILDRDIREVFPDLRERDMEKYIHDSLVNRRPVLLSSAMHEYLLPLEFIRDDSSVRMLQNVRLYPLLDGEAAASVAIVITDVSEQFHYSESLRNEKTFVQSIINAAQTIILVLDREGRISTFNPYLEEISGYRLEDVRGLDWIDTFLPESDRDLARERFLETLTDGRTGELERQIITRDGQARDIVWRDQPLLGGAGKPQGLLLVGDDITDRKLLEEQTFRAQRLESIGRLAGGVAHDLNNMLTPVIAYSEMLLEDSSSLEDKRDWLRGILSGGKRARDMVRQLLAFSRKQVLEFRNIDINELLAEFHKLIHRTLRENITLTLIPGSNLPLIHGDAGQVEQVIMNLVINAQDAMPEGGELVIETEITVLDEEYASSHAGVVPGLYVMLAFTDTGHGMDEETLASIFEPFFTTKEVDQGTGLGLATAYGIIKQHQGNIWVYSEPGQGTTFKVYLPASAISEEMEQILDEEPGDVHGSETILLAEDDELVRDLSIRVVE